MSKTKYYLLLLFLVSFFNFGCASSKPRPTIAHDFVVNQNLNAAKNNALDAIAVFGFVVMQENDRFIKGNRPNKMGLLVGSGGEIVTITLDPIEENKTNVHVNTKITFVGMVGQKNWNNEIKAEMLKADSGT